MSEKNERLKNRIVGLTAIVGLLLLAVLIVVFTGLPEIFQTGAIVEISLKETHSLTAGDPIYLRGKRVGIIRSVEFTDGDPRKGVTVITRINSDVALPTNIQAQIFKRGFTGKGYLSLTPKGALKVDPTTGKTIDYFAPDETIRLVGTHNAGSALALPKELTTAFADFGLLAKNLNALLTPPAPGGPEVGLHGVLAKMNRTLDDIHKFSGNEANQKNLADSLAQLAALLKNVNHLVGEKPASPTAGQDPTSTPTPVTLRATIARMDKTLDAIHALAADPELKTSIKKTFTNVEKVSASANELMRKLITDAESIDTVAVALHKTLAKINSGQGTAGKLLHDPKLYNSLVETTGQLDNLLRDLRKLAAKWDKEGVGIELK